MSRSSFVVRRSSFGFLVRRSGFVRLDDIWNDERRTSNAERRTSNDTYADP